MSYLYTSDLQKEIDDLEMLDEDRDAEENERFEYLTGISEEIGDEFRHGVTLIPDGETDDYFQQLAEDVGYLDGDRNPLFNYIDWEKWGRDCLMDYSSVDIDGETYWFRS